jgi:hypothetical protein
MNELKKITNKVILLIWDILIFTHQIVRKIILPNRRRKGNLLSSLLTFFVGLLDRIVSFESSLLRQPIVFSHKYVRQGLIIAVAFLFLLSSFEWTVGQPSIAPVNETQAIAADQPAPDGPTLLSVRQLTAAAALPAPARNFFAPCPPSSPPQPSLSGRSFTAKKYLRFGVFRI